jgi:pilus assembly protein CpaB
MKKVVLFAIIAALCAGGLLYFYLGNLEQSKEVKTEFDSVVVATQDIPAFTLVTADMVQYQQVPMGYAHPLATRSMEDVVGYVTECDIAAGEEMLTSKIKQFGETTSGLSYMVPTGMRAMTVSVDETSGVAGFIQRGDFVDVLAFTTVTIYGNEVKEAYREKVGTLPPGEIDESTESATIVVAQNICVGAIGTTFANKVTDPATPYTSVTLFVTPEDAMRILQASKSGVLALTLRASGDHERNTELPILSNQLLKLAK